MLRIQILLLAMLLPSLALAQRPPAVVPASQGAVLERLPKGYAALMPGPTSTTTTTTPADRLIRVKQLLDAAARTGDARLATHADALLAAFPADDSSPELLRARAFAAQHRHDFDGAVLLLDRLIRSSPRDGDARLSRAQIQLVQGRLETTRRDCATLAFGVDSGRGMLCVAAFSLRIGDYDAAGRVLDRWLEQADQDDGLRRYALVMRAEAASRAGADAGMYFRHALTLAPDDVRTLAAYARDLRRRGQHAQVLRLLADAPDSDGLQLERALAADAAGSADAARLAVAQGQRYALARAVGSEPELRDEAEFALTLQDDPQRALALALRNFSTQRDTEDVELLIRAAAATGRPETLQPLRKWAASQDLALPPATPAGS